MRIGDEVYIHGYVDEIRNDTVIIRNKGGYFGTVAEEVMPTATQSNESNALDVLERKKGKWEFVGLQMFVCSECKHGFRQDWLMDWRTHNSEPIFPNFCPNCGAKMREGEE